MSGPIKSERRRDEGLWVVDGVSFRNTTRQTSPSAFYCRAWPWVKRSDPMQPRAAPSWRLCRLILQRRGQITLFLIWDVSVQEYGAVVARRSRVGRGPGRQFHGSGFKDLCHFLSGRRVAIETVRPCDTSGDNPAVQNTIDL